MEALADIFTPNIELFPLVEELKRQGSKLVLISNTNECHYHYAKKHYPILNLFDVNILSYEVGACKPNPKIFGRALKEVKGKSFYTDDIPAFVKAGREAGLDAELFTDVPNLIHHLVQRRLLHENNVRF
jgi:putative hydrolase of the HAD superfamily